MKSDLVAEISIKSPVHDIHDVIEAVEGLLRAGEPVQALTCATDAIRRSRSTELERRLLGWRIEAFSHLVRGPGRADWPPLSPDPFPGMPGLPCIAAADLTGEILAGAILHHGALWVRGLISQNEAARFQQGIEAARHARDAYHEGARGEDIERWYAPIPGHQGAPQQREWVEMGDGVRTTDSPTLAFDLIDLFERNGVIDVIADYLGERPALSVLKSTLRRVGPEAGTDWHQDGAFLGATVRSVNVWLGLSACGEEAPGLDLVGRRVPYVLQTGSHGSIFDWAVGPGIVGMLEQGGAPLLSPVFAPGDAVLFDHLMLHRTGVRPGMTKYRWAIESWFFAPSAYPMEQIPIVI
jgi:hypothetical protein